ncbi:transcription factor ILR3 [Raphanus sativus]|uniref:Transcription factor ILR3 n=1 Tax=Raphanus sativus TaxID=3726 RepID=A0A9W3D5G5_RAPSA|nr:transcription factor ILR3 [Raphanus sativus]XP_056858654.1 transcription factor ILR3 [Raphanus sativus]
MIILKLLSEEVFDFSRGEMTQQKIKELKQSLNSEFKLIHELCLYVLSASQRQDLIRSTLSALHAYLSWIPLGYIFESPFWARCESSSATSSKACREKQRRDRLNDKFTELSVILEPGNPPKTDKAAILVDAVRMVTQLRGEAQKLKDSNSSLQDKIKELKTEKNELRDEKQRLKTEKEKLEQQLKAMNAPQPSFFPAPPMMPTAFASAQGQAPGNKMVPIISYPGVAMWQFMPPTSVDTSQDHVLRPPVA